MSRTMEANIQGTVEYLQGIWDAREELTAKAVERASPFFRRHKNIFYDTDGIRERQTESVKMCPDSSCSGYMTIDTDAVRGYGRSESGFGVFVPLFACKSCREEAREEYEAHKTDSRYNYIFFQDKNKDDFRLFATRIHNERVY